MLKVGGWTGWTGDGDKGAESGVEGAGAGVEGWGAGVEGTGSGVRRGGNQGEREGGKFLQISERVRHVLSPNAKLAHKKLFRLFCNGKRG